MPLSKVTSPALADDNTTLQEPLLPVSSPLLNNEGISSSNNNTNSNISTNATSSSIWIVDGLPWKTSYLIKSLYFVEALGSSTWGRFGTIYYAMHGLNPQQIGMLEGLMTAIPCICMPIWGIIADLYISRKVVYVITKFCSTILLLSLSTSYIYESYKMIIVISLCIKVFTSEGILDSYTLDLLGTIHQRLYGRYRLFASLSWGIGAMIMGIITDHYNSFEPNFILYGLLGILCLGLVIGYIPNQQKQSITITREEEEEGGGGATTATGRDRNEQEHDTFDVTNDDHDTLIHVPPVDATMITITTAPPPPTTTRTTRIDEACRPPLSTNTVGTDLVFTDHDPHHPTQSSSSTHIESNDGSGGVPVTPMLVDDDDDDSETDNVLPVKSLWNLVSLALRPRVFMFLIQVIIMGAAMATVERLLFLYMVQELQSSTTLCGLTVAVNVFFEIPIFWYGTWFLQTLGLDGMQILSQICFVVRVYGYTLLQPETRWYILPLEALHGITFACFWTVATDVSKSLIHETTPPEVWSTTIPSIVQMLYSAVGISIGSAVGGWAMQQYGARFMYRTVATILLVVLIGQIIGSIVVRVWDKRTSQMSSSSPSSPSSPSAIGTSSERRFSRSFLPDYTNHPDDNPSNSNNHNGTNDDDFEPGVDPESTNNTDGNERQEESTL